MESLKQSNKISDIVRLKQKLKKWRNQAHNAQINNSYTSINNNDNRNNSSSSNTKKGSLSRSNSIKGITFLKRTLSFTDASSNSVVPSNGFPPMDEARSNNSNSNSSNNNAKSNSSKKITFFKRTLSFTDVSSVSTNSVPKGFLAVHVGVEMKRFVIPTNYLSHQAFCTLLKEAEEEFGFQQEGVLRIPCEVEVFETILGSVDEKNNSDSKQGYQFNRNDGIVCGSIESQSLSQSHHPPSPMCR